MTNKLRTSKTSRPGSLALICALALSACNQQGTNTGEDTTPGEAEVVIKLHPLKQYCVEYKHAGNLTGTSKNCIRKWGNESFTIENLKIGFAGITQEQNAHKITIGDTVYNIDTAKKTGTKTKNPFYDALSKAPPEQLSQSILDGMQMTDTGEDTEIAGIKCNKFKSPQFGTACFTDNMVILEQSFMGVSYVATKLDLNSGGDDADYDLYKQVTITDGPDVGKILEQL